MIKIDKPDIVFMDHFQNCIKDRHEPLRANLRRCFGLIEEASREYGLNANNSQLFVQNSIVPQLSPVTTNDLVGVYENQMVGGPGREVYNKVKLLSNVCSFCAHRDSGTLDHYLSKSEYPEFSIFPLNLVPCCHKCNSSKSIVDAKCEEKQYLHPYFDDVSTIRWLEAQVLYSIDNSPAFRFFINKDAEDMNDVISNRLDFQFYSLKIDELYSNQAATELSGIEYYLKNIFEEGGETEVKSYLNEMAESKSLSNENTWQAAMYRAMASDDQFGKLSWCFNC